MASVTSLDSDMRNLRLSKYTPAAANQVRQWIEDTLREPLQSGDLLEALKDGVALCKLANYVLPSPGIRFKKSAMPFTQMENISHFLRACEMSPLNMPAHDRFLTVDLYESKDPAQVLQCLGAFSRIANTINPSQFPTAIGGKQGSALSPTTTGSVSRAGTQSMRAAASMSSMRPSSAMPSARPLSPTKTGDSTSSRNTGPVSSWSSKNDEGVTNPAWNIHQYGYMGGASQGNQGIMFGGRRQITSSSPSVPNLAEKQRLRKEKEAEEERLRQEAAETERKQRLEKEAEEERERQQEERRWEEETKRLREQERRRLEEQKRQWEEQEKRWKLEDEARQKEEAAVAQATSSNGLLNGQYLSQYQADQTKSSPKVEEDTPESRRVQELEKQLEEARERERQYQLEREQRSKQEPPQLAQPTKRVDSVERPSSAKDSEASWAPDEREVLRQAAPQRSGLGPIRPLPVPTSPASKTPEPSVRPLPHPDEYKPRPQEPNRTDNFLAQNKAPAFQRPKTHHPSEMGASSTLEEQADRDRRVESQQKTKAGAWASKSLLEREMERERERQKEWEANQEATKSAARDIGEGSAPGQSWNVNQYGFTGGDNQNRGSGPGSGISMGGRRQIIGPRPQPGQR
ncbi:hypothetical protein K461DRAFT_318700 [Myriangium duriaei CBS 260.36]|uniref:Calponin-homology (CH) domain-containing protein n=1 Tax=Myriangium duriaei CBS 260.36 TaxID=1168546 RepID=A0A9P4J7C9_9PEZI|nr:hypothetical protein K461DRAFT_318700 [Myriangium duriaei CBS 260.36]